MNENTSLKEMRLALGISQQQIASALSISPKTYSCWERGIAQAPDSKLSILTEVLSMPALSRKLDVQRLLVLIANAVIELGEPPRDTKYKVPSGRCTQRFTSQTDIVISPDLADPSISLFWVPVRPLELAPYQIGFAFLSVGAASYALASSIYSGLIARDSMVNFIQMLGTNELYALRSRPEPVPIDIVERYGVVCPHSLANEYLATLEDIERLI